MSEALCQFKARNGTLPHNVVLYRDGVGDSQQKAVLMYELPQLQAALRKAAGQSSDEVPSIKLIVISVNKRINQRFFNVDNPQRMQNPFPGTIVDKTVVANDTYDFFLVS